MAYKPTGKPVGRPKTKEYVTLLARVPADLAELVKRYAGEHGQSVAELIREGVEWRIGDGDPRGMGLYLAQPIDHSEKVYYTNTEASVDTESAELLREIRAEQVRLGERLQAVMQALEPRISGGERVQHTGGPGNAGVVDGDGDIPEASLRAQSLLGQAPAGEDISAGVVPEFDPEKYVLGSLCEKGHDVDGQGHSLRQRGGKHECRECKRGRSLAYKERQRAAKRRAVA